MPTPADTFRHCPKCAAANPAPGQNPFRCPACGFVYYFNPTVAAAAFLFDGAGKVLVIRRAKDPAKGKLAIPGGFVDFDEAAEDALRREVREEVGVEVSDLRFLGSCPNRYEYRGITYPVCDLMFTGTVADPAAARPLDAVAGIEWRHPRDVDPDELAFPSLRRGRELLLTNGG
jgi:ADP-ribose pyrophosphatase YjhB (NUDIX family)